MTVSLELSSNSEETVNTTLYILLEVEGLFYFLDVHGDTYPQFSEEIAGIELPIPFEFQLETEILALPLPQNLPEISGGWWGLLINSETGAAAGPVSMEPFEFI